MVKAGVATWGGEMMYVCVNPSLTGVFVEKLKKAPSLRTSASFTNRTPTTKIQKAFIIWFELKFILGR